MGVDGGAVMAVGKPDPPEPGVWQEMTALALAKNRSQEYICRVRVAMPLSRDAEAVSVSGIWAHPCPSWACASWTSCMAGLGVDYHGQAPKS